VSHGLFKNCKNYNKKYVIRNLIVFKYSGGSGGKTQVPGFAQFPLQQKGTFTVTEMELEMCTKYPVLPPPPVSITVMASSLSTTGC
jgi:hypothetical protein